MDKETRLKLAVQKSGRLTDHSLDLLGRCGLKLSRGKDQLMGFGENLPLDVLFVRDDDIPDLVQEDVCDLGMVGLNVLEERRLEMLARGATAQFRNPAARWTSVAAACRWRCRMEWPGRASPRCRASASPPPTLRCWRDFLARERHRGRDRDAVRRG